MCSTQHFIIDAMKTKVLVFGPRNLHGDVFKMGKQGDTELEHCCINVGLVHGEWSVCIGALKVDDVWRNHSNREVVECFIEASMSGNFDTGCFRVTPKDVLSGVRHTSKENATPGISLKFCGLFPWRLDPCTTPKGSKVREILNDVGGFCDW